MQANGIRAAEIGYEAAFVELGVDLAEARRACAETSHEWARLVPASPTLRDVLDLASSAELAGLAAGIRIGRMLAPTRLDGDTINELATAANRLVALADRCAPEPLDPPASWLAEVRAVAGIIDRVCAGARDA